MTKDYSKIGYSLRHDATFHADTKAWLENKCTEKDCWYCKDRPEDASEIVDHFKDIRL